MNALDIWDNWVQNDNTMTEISYSFCDFYDTLRKIDIKKVRKVNTRKVDRTKKSNIKCDHCRYWDRTQEFREMHKCANDNSGNIWTMYWNRCKCFDWQDEK